MNREIRKVYDVFEDGYFSFLNTSNIFRLGEFVWVNDKEYEIEAFYQSAHAKENEVDWILLKRLDGMNIWWLSVNPSEIIHKTVKQ